MTLEPVKTYDAVILGMTTWK